MNSDKLKNEIRKNALSFAKRRKLPIDETHPSALIFCKLEDNFHPESIENIHRIPDWNSRTRKEHTKVNGVLEMQSSSSSDALLMNIFCHPMIAKWAGIRKILGNSMETITFGVPGAVSKNNGQPDKTEIDMELPGLFCEAKLTEPHFTQMRPEVVESYDRFQETFHSDALQRIGADYDNYQIIRNLLAAKEHNYNHILFCDERRPDLVRRYMNTVSCLRDLEDRMRCRVIFWQEIVAACGGSLRKWIEEKYGI